MRARPEIGDGERDGDLAPFVSRKRFRTASSRAEIVRQETSIWRI
jgi:hypothetical protein